MIVSFYDLVLIFISLTSFSIYSILIKKHQHKMVLMFWANLITYLGFLCAFFIKKLFLPDHNIVVAIKELIFKFTYTNMPLYFLMGIIFVASLIVLQKLFENYDISVVMSLTQISVLLTAIGYLILGDPLYLPSLIGIAIICLGSLISAFKSIFKHSIAHNIRNIPKKLLSGAFIESLLLTGAALITYQCTQQTNITEWIMSSLKHIHSIPFSHLNPFFFNIGVRFFITVTFLIYLYLYEKKGHMILNMMKNEPLKIISAGLVYFTACYTYQMAYLLTSNKNFLAVTMKLGIPVTLLFGLLFLNEKITPPKAIGTVLILFGGLLTVLL